MYSTDEFASMIKDKHPEYKGVDNATLVQKILTKYPQYQNQIHNTPKVPDTTGFISDTLTKGVSTIAQTAKTAAADEAAKRGVDLSSVTPKPESAWHSPGSEFPAPGSSANPEDQAAKLKQIQSMVGGMGGALSDVGKSTAKATGEMGINTLNTFADVADKTGLSNIVGIKPDGGASRDIMQQGRDALQNADALKATTIDQGASDLIGTGLAYMAPAGAVSKFADLLPGGGFLGGLLRGGADITGQGALAATTARPEDRLTSAVVAGGATGVGRTVGGLFKWAKSILAPDAETALKSGIKPTGGREAVRNFDSNLKTVMEDTAPDAAKVIATSDSPLHALEDHLKQMRDSVWNQVEAGVSKGTKEGLTVDLSSFAPKVEALVEKYPLLNRQNPELFKTLIQDAKILSNEKLPVKESEKMIEEINANLNAFYQKTGVAKSVLLRSDPALAASNEMVKTLRGAQDALLGDSPLKQKYSAIVNVLEQVQKRIPIAERQNLTSLAEQRGLASAAGNFGSKALSGDFLGAIGSLGEAGVAHDLKMLETSNSKIGRAFAQIAKQNGGANFIKTFLSTIAGAGQVVPQIAAKEAGKAMRKRTK